MNKIRIWDLPTRLFHWALPVALLVLFITGDLGGNLMEWHMRTGYAVGALVLFRLIWGFVGGRWSRFSSFVPTPQRLLAYLKGQPGAFSGAGHNPIGAFSVLAMLLVLALQVGTGLLSDDEIAFTGPLYSFVSSQISGLATWYHKEVGSTILLVLVGLHLAAIVFYRAVKQQRLVHAMLSGDQAVNDQELSPSQDSTADRLLALAVFAGCAAGMAYIASLGG